jgi:hypothetical protein
VPIEAGTVSTAVEAAPTVAVEPGEPYCAQRTSRLFHKSDCAWGRADSRGRARLLQACRRGPRAGVCDLPRLRALGAGVVPRF